MSSTRVDSRVRRRRGAVALKGSIFVVFPPAKSLHFVQFALKRLGLGGVLATKIGLKKSPKFPKENFGDGATT